MSHTTFTIFAPRNNDPWRLGTHDPAAQDPVSIETLHDIDPSDTEAVSQALASALRDRNHTGSPVLLALPANRIMVAPVRTDDLPRRDHHAAARYRLEESMPIAAEHYAADLIQAKDNTLGVCTDVDQLKPWLEAFEQADISIDCICPTDLIAMQLALAEQQNAEDHIAICPDGSRINVFLIRNQRPICWYTTGDLNATLNAIHLDSAESFPTRIYAESNENTLLKLVPDSQFIKTQPADHLATQSAAKLNAGRLIPWINLRRDALAQTDPLRPIKPALRFAVTAACSCLLCLAVAFQWQAHQYRSIQSQQTQAVADIFQSAFPTSQTVPADPLSRLHSEHKKLANLTGQSTDLPSQTSALIVIHQTLRRLPTDLRYRVLEIRTDNNKIHIEGQARTHADADRIANALRAQRGFDIESPRTERLSDQGISFTLIGRLLPPTKEIASR